ncbi:endoribonuclease Dicer [Elysia marginata]|uniref:Endoribonuclease Dicer n=1 Tax=Elysia marginata TaxID=1093978 RepID=A0AAV4J473_9GAST|nr:endoribonuclease Dicer [Elysia marginata]
MAASSGVGRKGSRYHRLDNIPTNTFTPRTYQIQLLDAALQKNTLLCQGCPNSKLFLALMVAKEMSSATRSLIKNGGKRTFFITNSEEEVEIVTSTIPHHTDLKVGSYPPVQTHVAEQEKDNCENTRQESQSCKHRSVWQQLVESNNIIVCTGTNFLEALENGFVLLKIVNLLIFDDCHHSVSEGHPYASIVSLVQQLDEEGIAEPRILGVTAAIAGTDCSDPDQLKITISSMESAMHAKAQTSMLILTERFGCRPRQKVIRCDLDDFDPVGIDEEQAQLRQTMEGLLLRDYHFFLDCREQLISQAGGKDPGETPRQVLEQCLTILSVLGPWCCSSVGEYFHMQMEKIVKQERCDIHKRCMRCVMTTLRMLTRTFEASFHPDYCVHEFLSYTTPKVRALVNSLRKFKPEVDFIIVSNYSDDPDGDDLSDLSDDGDNDEEDDDSISGSDGEEDNPNKTSLTSKPVHIAVKRNADGVTERITGVLEEEEKNLCGIVFVENRYIAFGLSKVIEEVCSWDEDLCFVKSCHITGQGLKGAGGSAKHQRSNRACKRQEEALRKFRTQEVNLVIATPELEEGIDIPKCNLVVRFDPPKDYRSYTLSKGRARARDASFIILLDADTYEGFQSRLGVFKGIEQVGRIMRVKTTAEKS